jgi:hypothetical protein
MTTTTMQNGRQRKSLAEQIDRLDGILDGLADGLNEAVATAVKEAVTLAVRQAVQAVMTELVTNHDLLALIRGPLSQAATPIAEEVNARPDYRPAGLWRRASAWARQRWTGAIHVGGSILCLAGSAVAAGWRFVRRFKGPVMLALGVGTVVGLGSYLMGPVVASLFSGLAGFAGTLAARALNALRRLLVIGEPATS